MRSHGYIKSISTYSATAIPCAYTHTCGAKAPMLSRKIGLVLFSPFVLSLSKYERGEQSANTGPPFTIRQAQNLPRTRYGGERLCVRSSISKDLAGQQHAGNFNATPLGKSPPRCYDVPSTDLACAVLEPPIDAGKIAGVPRQKAKAAVRQPCAL